MKAQGELTTQEAARLLGAHPNTLRRWAAQAIAHRRSPVSKVRADWRGWYFFDRSEIESIAQRATSSAA